MPPQAKRDCGIILFDVNSSKKPQLLELLIKFSTYKKITGSKDFYRLLLVNCSETDNEEDTPNIVTTDIRDLEISEIIETVNGAEGTGESDWMESIELALHYFNENERPTYVVTTQLIFLTTLENESKNDTKTVKNIVRNLNEQGIYFYIIGPDVTFNSWIRNWEDLRKSMRELSFDNISFATALEIVKNCDTSAICNIEMGFDLLNSFKLFPGGQPWNVPLTFGDSLTISCSVFKEYCKDDKLALSTVNRPAYADEEKTELNCGVLKHDKFVNIPDEKMFQVEQERRFRMICITKAENVPEIYMTGEDTFRVVPTQNPELFLYFVKVLKKQNKYIIAERVYMKNTNPKYYALIPHTDLSSFVMTEISYADDVDPDIKVSIPVKSCEKSEGIIAEMCDKLRENEVQEKNMLGPEMQMDTYSHRVIEKSAEKLVNVEIVKTEESEMMHFVQFENNFVETLKMEIPMSVEEEEQEIEFELN